MSVIPLDCVLFPAYSLSMNKQHPPKKPALSDWHRADIVAGLHKAGWSLRRLSAHHGYASPSTLTHALNHRWPKGERLVAAAIGIDPAEIWPSRYPHKSSTRTNSEAA